MIICAKFQHHTETTVSNLIPSKIHQDRLSVKTIAFHRLYENKTAVPKLWSTCIKRYLSALQTIYKGNLCVEWSSMNLQVKYFLNIMKKRRADKVGEFWKKGKFILKRVVKLKPKIFSRNCKCGRPVIALKKPKYLCVVINSPILREIFVFVWISIWVFDYE